MTRTTNQFVATLMCLSIFAGATHASVLFSSDTGYSASYSAFGTGNDWPGYSSHSNSSNDNDDNSSDDDSDDDDGDNGDDNSLNHKLFSDQVLKLNVTLDAVPQLYHLELTAKPHFSSNSSDHGNNNDEHSSDTFSFDIGVNINGQSAGVITFDSISNHWTTGWLNVGQLSGNVSITLDWLNPPPFKDDDDFLKIRPLNLTPVIPTPATVVLMLTSFGLSAPRRSRR